jgi:HAD superfamily hydrolase (TIGR01509 family)
VKVPLSFFGSLASYSDVCYFDFREMKTRKHSSSVAGDRMGPVSVNGKSTLDCVLFDWDGTLLDSFEADAQAYIHMFAALGMTWSMAELKRHYSPNWHHVYRTARLPRAKWEEADRLWMKFYRTHQPELQPGARRVLRALERRFTLALVSSGSRARVRRQLREHEVAALFRTKVCSEDAPRRKPHPAPLRLALDRLGLSPKVCVYIGDAPEDIEMAHRAGVRAIGVLGGSPVPERLRAASPDATIETIRELPSLLRNF